MSDSTIYENFHNIPQQHTRVCVFKQITLFYFSMKQQKKTVIKEEINFQLVNLYLETIIQEQKQVSGSVSDKSYIFAL